MRWAEMQAPVPGSRYADDTALVDLPAGRTRSRRRTGPAHRRFGNIAPGHMDVGQAEPGAARRLGEHATALLVYSGITVKMMVDTDLGAQLTTMFMVHYDPTAWPGAYDHPFEETY